MTNFDVAEDKVLNTSRMIFPVTRKISSEYFPVLFHCRFPQHECFIEVKLEMRFTYSLRILNIL